MGNASGQILVAGKYLSLITSYHLPLTSSWFLFWLVRTRALTFPASDSIRLLSVGQLKSFSMQWTRLPITHHLYAWTNHRRICVLTSWNVCDTSVRMPNYCVVANKKLRSQPRWKPGPGFFESRCAVVQQSGEIATFHFRHCITAVTPTCQNQVCNWSVKGVQNPGMITNHNSNNSISMISHCFIHWHRYIVVFLMFFDERSFSSRLLQHSVPKAWQRTCQATTLARPPAAPGPTPPAVPAVPRAQWAQLQCPETPRTTSPTSWVVGARHLGAWPAEQWPSPAKDATGCNKNVTQNAKWM